MIDIKIEDIGEAVIISVYGSLTRETVKEAEDVWMEVLSKSPEVIALDMKELAHIDSISINHLFKFAKTISEEDTDLIIYDVSKQIRDIFDVIKLSKVVSIMDKKEFEKKFLRGETY